MNYYTDSRFYCDERIETKDDVLFASPIIVYPNNPPMRFVLRHDRDGHKFITHREYLKTAAPDNDMSCKFVHDHFSNGEYFAYNFGDFKRCPYANEEAALHAAKEDFEKRIKDCQ